MNPFGFVRVAAASPCVHVADPLTNVGEMIRMLGELDDADIVLFPECGITGYTCGDLFGQSALLKACRQGLGRLCAATRGRGQLVVVGLPLEVGGSLFNCAAAVHEGRVLGIVPKQFIPNYKEYYESRWFSSANGEELKEISLDGEAVPFGIDLLFSDGDVVVGVEICEDLWMPIPPSSFQALAGANILLNLSASNETIGKSRYRRDLVVGQSGRCLAAYAYASCGPSESTTDVVFGGHCLIAENGHLLAESPRVGDGGPAAPAPHSIVADVDVERLMTDRRVTTSFDDCMRHLPGDYRRIPFTLRRQMEGLRRVISGTPFVPRQDEELNARCAEIFGIQCAGLAKRMERLPTGTPLYVGVSGGLDSTLALLVAVKTCDLVGAPRSTVHGLTMPGFGTSPRTLTNAIDLMRHLEVTSEMLDIRQMCLHALRALGHAPFGIDCTGLELPQFEAALAALPDERKCDLVFENCQARMRTFLLMNRGFVVGTGDMSEQALGWSTYNGDHMSMYNPNCSIPKTLVKFLVRYVALHEFRGAARATLLSIADTVISPELLPLGSDGTTVQSTEQALGAYELHDFFLFYFVRHGFTRDKILFLARHAHFDQPHDPDAITRALDLFLRRFFANQFKRSCVPDGPKVGTVSLSPRGDWRMPSDAEVNCWLDKSPPEPPAKK